MKFRLLALILLFARISADETVGSYWSYHPLHVGGNFIRLGKADLSHEPGNLHFRKSNVYAQILLPITYKNYFFPRVELNYVTLDWNKNPKFHETHFYYMQFGLTFFSIALEKWKWIARIDYNLQLEHLSHPGQYSLFSGLLWGTNEIFAKWHYHVGALGYGGLEGGTLFPIIGLDYAPNDKWFVEVIFPITYSVRYKYTERWTFSLKGRPLKERLRVGSREPQPRSIFNYSSIGTELNIEYNYKDRLLLEGFGGYNFGGRFYIKNAHGHHAIYTDVKGSPYFGAHLDYAI